MGDLFDLLFIWGIGALLALLLGLLGWLFYDEATAQTFELRKDEWGCSASHEETTTIWVSGPNNTMQPFITSSTVCDRWERRR